MATALSQGLVVLASPALTRLYEPADFGALAVFVSLISALVVVGTGRYELATPLPDSDEEAAQVLALALGFAGATALAAAAAAFAFGDRIAEALGAPTLAPHLWMLAAG
ncbi:MAG: oligosaccharide flippase family protein, partial [Candidatus Methylomirabilis sp.]|nr:oligosaccharide flippase family protein [Deltaproteobacteria bacterium]